MKKKKELLERKRERKRNLSVVSVQNNLKKSFRKITKC